MNSAGISLTSYWINFFIDAGIPAADAAQYAMIFSDNRLDETMLMDLKKEYLNDIGITRLGDIIAVLKRAKVVHEKLVENKVLQTRERALKASLARSSQATPSPVSTHTIAVQTRRDTPLTRIVGRCLEGNRSSSPSPGLNYSDNNARLGAQKEDANIARAKRNVTIPEDASVPVSVVKQNNSKTAASAASSSKKSVFARLGTERASEAGSASAHKTENTGTLTLPTESVFNRLGEKCAVKRPASSTSTNDDAEMESPPLQYAGVLVSPPKIHKPAPLTITKPASTKKAATTHTVTLDQSPISLSATSSEGILAGGTQVSKRLKDRLGNVVSPADTTQFLPVGDEAAVAASHSASPWERPIRQNLKIIAKNPATNKSTGVKARLQANPAEVSSSSDGKVSSKRVSVLSRLGLQI